MKKRFFTLVMALFLCAGLAAPASAANGAALDYKVNTADGPIRFLTEAERDEERMKIAQSIKEDGGTVITQQETPTDPHCQERLKAMEETLKGGGMAAAQPETPTRIPANGSYYTSVKGTPIFTPEQNKGAHYYAFSDYGTAYQGLFVNVKLPTEFNSAGRRTGFLAVGLYGSLGGVDLGLRNDGTGWMPCYWDTVGGLGANYAEYTAPSTATNAVICANVANANTVYFYVRFVNASGNTVGTIFEKQLQVGSGNFTFSGGQARCRYYRFASLVPNIGVAENRKDGSYMRGAQFTNCNLYNGSAYESWGISTARVVSAWKVYPENITLSWTTYNDVFNINHT
jgi:hypothetical protein